MTEEITVEVNVWATDHDMKTARKVASFEAIDNDYDKTINALKCAGLKMIEGDG